MKRWLIRIGLLLIFLLAVAYSAAGAVVYNRATEIDADCFQAPRDAWADNRPDSYHTGGVYDIPEVDTSPYLMPDYQEVSFASRGSALTIRAWFVPADSPNAPAVILVHGLNNCRHSPTVLLPAGMLHRAGFQTLLIDLRNHGTSDRLSGRMSGGIEEYQDVLGAWDWLVQQKGLSPARIGLFGVSLGAASALIAAGEDSRVAAVWSDSSYSDVSLAIEQELDRLHYPQFLGPAGIFLGRLIDGVDISARSPLEAVRQIGQRAVFITHGESDTRILPQHAAILVDAIRLQQPDFEAWTVPGSVHAQAMFTHLDEYERRLVAFFSTSLA